MKPYIEDRNLNKYEFDVLSRKQKIKLANCFKNINKESLDDIENAFYDLMKFNYAELTKEQFDDILDFNEEIYGFEALYELIGAIIEDVFTLVGGEAKAVHPYLQMKKQMKQEVEMREELKEEVSEEQTPVVEEVHHEAQNINPIYY